MSFRILWRAIKTTVFLFGLVGLVAWFAATAPWYWRAGSALVVLAALALTYQIFAALHVRCLAKEITAARGMRRVSLLRRQAGAGKAPQKIYSRAVPEIVDDEMTPVQRRRLIAEIEARA